MHRIILLVALLLCVSFLKAEQCNAGSYEVEHKSSEGTFYFCEKCGPGHYCPGDNKSYQCSEHSYTEEFEQTSCKPCNRPLSDKKGCMLDDVPDDIRQIVDTSLTYGSSVKFSVKGSAHFVYDNTRMLSYQRDYLPTLNVFQKPGQSSLITAYLSNNTGIPSESSHTLKVVGVNITAVINHIIGRNSLMYITLEFQRPIEINVGFSAQSTYKHVIKPGVTEYRQTGFITLNVFTIPSIKTRSKITFSVSTMKTTRTNYIFWSSDKSIPYPNELNYQAMVSGYDEPRSRTLTVEDQGDVTFSFYTYLRGDAAASVKVEVVPL